MNNHVGMTIVILLLNCYALSVLKQG